MSGHMKMAANGSDLVLSQSNLVLEQVPFGPTSPIATSVSHLPDEGDPAMSTYQIYAVTSRDIQ